MKKTTLALMALALMCSTPALADHHTAEDKAAHYMKKMDTNNDGMVSKAEHDAFSNKKFDDADTNNDGMLSRDEMIAKNERKMDMKKDR